MSHVPEGGVVTVCRQCDGVLEDHETRVDDTGRTVRYCRADEGPLTDAEVAKARIAEIRDRLKRGVA